MKWDIQCSLNVFKNKSGNWFLTISFGRQKTVAKCLKMQTEADEIRKWKQNKTKNKMISDKYTAEATTMTKHFIE